MGVNGLWQTPLSETGESTSLLRYTSTQTKYLREHEDRRPFRMGIDFSPAMAECVAATSAPSLHGGFTGGAVYIFFNKLMAFLSCPMVLIFVMDGPRRPEIKRGTQVQTKDPHWKKRAIDIIQHCGYYVHQAPGEAEAELAALNQNGYLDAVITVDSDIFVFGMVTLLRSIPKNMRSFDDEYILFTEDAVRDRANLTRGGLILYALLAGGDYADGISGFGKATAYTLAQADFGDALIQAIETMSGAQLKTFLEEWRQSLCAELDHNVSKLFTKRPPRTLSSLLDHTFPDLAIVELYHHPLTSWSDQTTSAALPDPRFWIHREPDIPAIAKFCASNFDWDTGSLLNTNLASRLWEPIFLQILYSKYVLYDPEKKLLATPFNNSTIIDFTYVFRKGKHALATNNEPQARLVIQTEGFIGMLGAEFKVLQGEAVSSIVVHAPPTLLPPSLKPDDFLKKRPVKASRKMRVKSAQAMGSDGHKTSATRKIIGRQKQKMRQKDGSALMRAASVIAHSPPIAGPSKASAHHSPTTGRKNRNTAKSVMLADSDNNRADVPVQPSSSTAAHHHPQTVVDLTGSDADDIAQSPDNLEKRPVRRNIGFLDLTGPDAEGC